MARQPVKSTVKALIEKLLADLIAEPRAWAFQHPVDPIDVPDYFDVVKQPMGACSI
jgi:histone acetyltransferase